jgi:hypothetical protein
MVDNESQPGHPQGQTRMEICTTWALCSEDFGAEQFDLSGVTQLFE